MGRGLRRRFFFAGGQSWRVEGKSSASCEEDGVGYRNSGSGVDSRDDAKELKSETLETSEISADMAKMDGGGVTPGQRGGMIEVDQGPRG